MSVLATVVDGVPDPPQLGARGWYPVSLEPGVSIKNPAQYASRHIMASFRPGCPEMLQGARFGHIAC